MLETSLQDFVPFQEDFLGGATITTTVGEGIWLITDTSAAGTPTYVKDSAHGGSVTLTLAATNEVENVCLDFGNKLHFDIDQLDSIKMRVKVSGTINAATIVSFGLSSNRADDTDTHTNNALFKLAGSASVVCETDDGTTDNDDKATGTTLTTTYKTFLISFAKGKSDVRFFIDNVPVATSTTFSMAAATGLLQPFVQIQKASGTQTDAVTVDYITVMARRN